MEGRALDWLTKDKGIAEDVVIAQGLRFCGREYQDIMNALKERFGEDALLVAGLLKRTKTGRLVPSFWYYFAVEKDGYEPKGLTLENKVAWIPLLFDIFVWPTFFIDFFTGGAYQFDKSQLLFELKKKK